MEVGRVIIVQSYHVSTAKKCMQRACMHYQDDGAIDNEYTAAMADFNLNSDFLNIMLS